VIENVNFQLLVVFYRLFRPIVTIAISDHSAASNVSDAQINRRWVTLEQNLAKKGSTNVSRISTWSWRKIRLSYTKEIVLISSAVWAQCTNVTDK